MDKWLWRYLYLHYCGTWKHQSRRSYLTEDLSMKKKMIYNCKHCNPGKYRKCLLCYKTKLTFFSCSLQQQKKLRQLRSGLLIKSFDSEMILFGMDWEGITCYGQKHFRERNNLLCKKALKIWCIKKMIMYAKFYSPGLTFSISWSKSP